MKKALITGGAGFLGTNLADELLNDGWQVRLFDIADLDEPSLQDRVEFIKGDIRDAVTVKKACEGVDVIYHTAALVPLSKAGKAFWEVNEGGTRNVLEAAKELGIPKVVHVSTSAIYGKKPPVPITEETPFDPLGDYGMSKHAGEELCRKFRSEGLDVSIIRPRTIVGNRRLGIFQMLFEWIKEGRRVYIFGNGSNQCQLISAADCSRACILAAEKGAMEDFNVGCAEFGTVREDLEELVKYAGTKSRIVGIPAGFCRNTLRVLDKLRLSPLAEWHYETSDKDYVFGTEKAGKMLGWEPTRSNFELLRDAYDYFTAHYEKVKSRKKGTTHRTKPREKLLGFLRKIS